MFDWWVVIGDNRVVGRRAFDWKNSGWKSVARRVDKGTFRIYWCCRYLYLGIEVVYFVVVHYLDGYECLERWLVAPPDMIAYVDSSCHPSQVGMEGKDSWNLRKWGKTAGVHDDVLPPPRN